MDEQLHRIRKRLNSVGFCVSSNFSLQCITRRCNKLQSALCAVNLTRSGDNAGIAELFLEVADAFSRWFRPKHIYSMRLDRSSRPKVRGASLQVSQSLRTVSVTRDP